MFLKVELIFDNYNYTKTENAFEIDKGLFTGNFRQILNKWTYGFSNTFIGNFMGHGYNLAGKVNEVTHLDGAVALSGITSGEAAFAVGNYLFVHEYGHYVQSQWFGPLYLPIIATTSLASAAGIGGGDHKTRWFEVQASRIGVDHFDGYTDGTFTFDRSTFERGGIMPYNNPRYLANFGPNPNYYGGHNPTTGARFSSRDVIVPVISVFTLSFLF